MPDLWRHQFAELLSVQGVSRIFIIAPSFQVARQCAADNQLAPGDWIYRSHNFNGYRDGEFIVRNIPGGRLPPFAVSTLLRAGFTELEDVGGK